MGDTIYDIARKAGVSISTVSRVLNGSDHPVRETTRQRVLNVIAESDYSPNHMARSLATNTTSTLGVIGSGLTNPYFVEMLNSISNVASRYELQILLQDTRDVRAEIASVRLLLDRRVDGIIFVAHHEDAPDYRHIFAAAEKVPVVLVGQPLKGSSAFSVRANEEAGIYELASRLLALGHRDFLFLGGSPHSYSTEVKLRGLSQALNEVGGCRLKRALTGYSYEAVQERLPGLLDQGLLDWCTAIVAVSDYVAIAALDVLHDRRIDVPDVVSVTGCDNVFWTRSVRPTLTTVDPRKHQLAELAVDTFLKALRGERRPRKNTIISTEVVLRTSHGPARAVRG